jgi:pantothenate kinase type III
VGRPIKVIGTGGLSAVLTDISNAFDMIDVDLTLKGLALYGQKTQM